jgi:hypothetical protein
LSAELVAWKREDLKALGVVFVMKRTQTCVLRRKASSTRNVNDQAHLIFVGVKRDRFTRDRFHTEVGKSRHLFTVVAVWIELRHAAQRLASVVGHHVTDGCDDIHWLVCGGTFKLEECSV